MIYTLLPVVLAVIGWIIVKFIEAPKLNIHIAISSSYSGPKGYVNLVPHGDDPTVADPRKSVALYHLKYYLTISINNVGRNAATDVSYYFHNDSPTIDIHNFVRKDQLLSPGTEYKYEGRYTIYQHSSPEDRKRNDAVIKGVLLRDLQIMFRYEGVLGLYRYSIYSHENNSTKHTYIPPIRFKSLDNYRLPENYRKSS